MIDRVRWCVQVLAVSAAVATLASGAGAQAGPMVPVCPDGAAPTVDSSIVVVGLAPSPEFRGRRYSAAQRLHILYIADAIRARFVPPPSLGALPVVGDASSGDPRQRAVARSVLHAEFIVVLRPDGHLRRIAWQVQPLSAPLGDALLTAVRAAEDSGALAEIHAPAGAKGDDTLAITLVTTNDSTPPELPLMRARVPVFVVDSLPMVVKMNLPAYPEAARAARVPGEVEAWFVLGSDSHVMPESVQFRRADWQEFIGPIRTALTTSRFQAAQSGGCRVPTFARQRFAFELR